MTDSNRLHPIPFQAEKKISCAIKVETVIPEKTSSCTSLSTDCTTWVSPQTAQSQVLMQSWASDTTTLKGPVTGGGIRTPCQPTESISLKELRVTLTATMSRIRRTESTTTSILEQSWSLTIQFFMDSWRKYFLVKTNIWNDAMREQVQVYLCLIVLCPFVWLFVCLFAFSQTTLNLLSMSSHKQTTIVILF